MRAVQSVTARAPGRVNLIGDHTDYNGGFVLPCAIAYETAVRARPEESRSIRAESPFGSASFELAAMPSTRKGDWSDYLRGVIVELQRAGVALRGCALEVTSNLPAGAGLSSSASFEIAAALALLGVGGASLPPLELALLAQRAEELHAGTRCGIMDQFTVLHARPGHAILLDARSLSFSYVAVPNAIRIVVCNTMVKHELSAGSYNQRRSECEAAAAILRERYPGAAQLRDVSMEELEQARTTLPPLLYRRARHVVSENNRVPAAAQSLKNADVRQFGELMNASHESLRDDFEVSCPELDLMVELARDLGALGARMTGGGFGGCTVNAVPIEEAMAFCERIARAYRSETGIAPDIYDGTPAGAARVARDG